MKHLASNTLLVLFIIIWTIFFLLIGVPKLFIMLGGSTGVFFCLPIISVIGFKYKFLRILLFNVIITLSSIVIINYLYSYFLDYYFQFGTLTRIYIICTPIWFMLAGYVYSVYFFLSDINNSKFLSDNKKKTLKNFVGFLVAVFWIPVLSIIPILEILKSLRNINSIGYQIGLGGLITGGLLFLFEARKIPLEVLNYVSKPIERFEIDKRKIRNYLLFGIIVFFLVSSYWEVFYRGHYIMWLQTYSSIVIWVMILYEFGTVIVIPVEPYRIRSETIYLPSIKSRRTINIALIFVVFYIFLLLTLKST